MAEDGKKWHTSTNEGIVLKMGSDAHIENHELDRSQIHYSENETKHLEDGLPMKLMKFMGLPKSYRQTLYNEFVADVNAISSIPTETASSLINLVSWVCGKNEDDGGNTVGDAEEKETLDWAREIHEVFSAAKASSAHHPDGKYATNKSSNITIVTPFSSHTKCNCRLCKPSLGPRSPENSKHRLMDLEKATDLGPQNLAVQNLSVQISVDENNNIKNNHEISPLITKSVCFQSSIMQEETVLAPEMDKHINETNIDECFTSPSALESETNIYSFQYDEDNDTPDEMGNEVPVNELLSMPETKIHDTNENDGIFASAGVAATSETYIYSYQYDEEDDLKPDDGLLDNPLPANGAFTNGGVPATSETNIYAYQYEDDYEEDDYIIGELPTTVKSTPNGSGEGPDIAKVTKCEGPRKTLSAHVEGQADTDAHKQLTNIEAFNKQFASDSHQKYHLNSNKEAQINDNDPTNIKDVEEVTEPLNGEEETESLNGEDETTESLNTEEETVYMNVESDTYEETKEHTMAYIQDEPSDIESEPETPLDVNHNCEPESAVQYNAHVFQNQNTKLEEIAAEHHQPNVICRDKSPLVEQRKTPSSIHLSSKVEIAKEVSSMPSYSVSSHVLQSGMKSQLRPSRKSSLKEVTFAPTCKDRDNEFPSGKIPENKESPDKPKPTTSEMQIQLNEDLKTLEDIVKKLYKNLNKKGPITIVANFKPTKDGQLEMDLNNNNVQASKTQMVVSSTHSLINASPARRVEGSKKIPAPKEEKANEIKEKVEEIVAAPVETIPIPQKVLATNPLPVAKTPINLSAKPIKSSLSLKSKTGPGKNKVLQEQTKVDVNNNEQARHSNTGRPTKRVSLDLCSISECKSSNSKASKPNQKGDAEKNRSRQQPINNTISEHPPLHVRQPCYVNKAETISIKASGGCQLHPESQTNLRVIRKCNSHTIQLQHQEEEQRNIKESASEASTSDASSMTSESTGKEMNESRSKCYSSTKIVSKGAASTSQLASFGRKQTEGARVIKTKVYIPAAPESQRKTTYRDIFREKRNQQQAQTVYVDLTSKGKREPQSLKSRSIHFGSKNSSDS